MMYLKCVSPTPKHNKDTVTYWYEQVRDLLLILSPGLAVLSATPRDVSLGTVDDHDHEEDKVKPRKRAPGREVSKSKGQGSCENQVESATYLNPVTRPQDIEKNISGT